jgi:hypothetical protein
MFTRTPDNVEAVRLLLKPFFRSGYALFPLSKGKKRPRDAGWQKREYSQGELKRWVEAGGNLGVALQACDLIVDIDPRNFAEGDDPFRRLCRELGIDLGAAPTVLSGRGDGGRHIYYRKPTALRIRGRLEGYEGIDFKSRGGFVLAPGSIHPATGGVYMPDDFAPPIGEVKTAPRALLERLARRQYAAPADNRIGKISNEQLTVLLSALDPTDYGQGHYDDFIRLAAACHDATKGAGLAAWLEWCAGDPAYGDGTALENNIRHWESFTTGRPDGVTFRTLLKAVADAGRPDLVAALGEDDDAIEEDLLIYEIETETDDG